MTGREDDSLLALDELAAVLREHEGPPAPRANGTKRREALVHRRRRHRVALLGGAVALALLLGSAFGFGLGSALTPSGTARSNTVGFGFLPARGWNVVQSGALDSSGTARAIAANVPLASIGGTGTLRPSTLGSLPERAVVLEATFTLRGDPGEDFKFPDSRLPLRLATAVPIPLSEAPLEHRLRAGVGGYNVEVRIYFGAARPSTAQLADTQSQLNRLVVAAERVTIAARPAIAPMDRSVTLFGSIDSGQSGEPIEIQAKDCGQTFFRSVAGATTTDGGGWSHEYWSAITTTLRAVWKDSASPPITVKKRTMIHLTPKAGGTGRYTVWLVAQSSFWRKRVLIQRRDQRLGVWRRLRSVVLTEQRSGGGTVVGFSAEVALSVPRGTQLRAFVPASQARPCYLSAASLPVRT